MAIRKVSSHFDYLEKRSYGVDVFWEPVRGDLKIWLLGLLAFAKAKFAFERDEMFEFDVSAYVHLR
jgi:hypothetical protein